MRILITGSVMLLLLASLAGYAGEYYFLFDLLSHFRVYYLIAAVVFLISASYRRWTYSILSCLVIIFINAAEIAPMFSLPIGAVEASPRPRLKLMSVNVWKNHGESQVLLNMVEREKPDIIGLVEVSPAWHQAITPLTKQYRYYHVVPRDDNFGMALLSRIPLQDIQEHYHSAAHVPSLRAGLIWENYRTEVVLVHPLIPTFELGYEYRNQELKGIEKMLSLSEGKIIMGDFNITRYSPIYKRFVKTLDLKNVADGYGWLPTWPRIPLLKIDHIFVDRRWRVLSTKRGEYFGSDHRPLISEIQLGS